MEEQNPTFTARCISAIRQAWQENSQQRDNLRRRFRFREYSLLLGRRRSTPRVYGPEPVPIPFSWHNGLFQHSGYDFRVCEKFQKRNVTGVALLVQCLQ